jgi:hypothetical protein
MRLSASRIRSINRRLAQAQGFAWPAHDADRLASFARPTHAPVPLTPNRTVKIVAVQRSVTA